MLSTTQLVWEGLIPRLSDVCSEDVGDTRKYVRGTLLFVRIRYFVGCLIRPAAPEGMQYETKDILAMAFLATSGPVPPEFLLWVIQGDYIGVRCTVVLVRCSVADPQLVRGLD